MSSNINDEENLEKLKDEIRRFFYYKIQYHRYISHRTERNLERITKLKERILELSPKENICVGNITLNHIAYHQSFPMVYTKSMFKTIESYCEKNKKKWEEEILIRQKRSSKKRKSKPSKARKYDSFQKNSTLYKAFPFTTSNIGTYGKKINKKEY